MPDVIIQPAGHDVSVEVESILRSVPEWFGIESATRKYIEDAALLPTWIARDNAGGAALGFATLRRHFAEAWEIHCMAVRRSNHGRGIGRALVESARRTCRQRGGQFLQVKTMGPSKPNQEYALTLKFYLSCGFVPLEEIKDLASWGGLPALQLVMPI